MATKRKSTSYNSDPLDELLEKLASGDLVDQSINEFSDTVRNYQDIVKNSTKSTRSRNSYAAVKPKINSKIENATYASRYEQVTNCLSNIEYANYPQEKADAYKQAIERYLSLVEENRYDLRNVEKQVSQDIYTCQRNIRENPKDLFTLGYSDAVTMVKKVLFNSKLARFRELSNKLK